MDLFVSGRHERNMNRRLFFKYFFIIYRFESPGKGNEKILAK